MPPINQNVVNHNEGNGNFDTLLLTGLDHYNLCFEQHRHWARREGSNGYWYLKGDYCCIERRAGDTAEFDGYNSRVHWAANGGCWSGDGKIHREVNHLGHEETGTGRHDNDTEWDIGNTGADSDHDDFTCNP